MNIIGINHASRFIPLFVKYMSDHFVSIKEGDKINFSQTSNSIIFSFILTVLFGKDINMELGMCKYENKDGSIQKMKLQESMMTLGSSLMSESIKLYNILFPQLIHLNIGTENRRNERNNSEFIRILREFLAQSTDETSVYRQAVEELKIDPEEVFVDCIDFLTGGHETTYKTWTSALYCLKKYPECLKLLMKDIEENINIDGKTTAEDFLKDFNPETLDEFDYLSMFLKEVKKIFIN